MEDREIEVRFLEIDKASIVAKLLQLGAEDFQETKLEEVIIYDPDLKWLDERRLIRLRQVGGKTRLTYKEHHGAKVDSAREIEFEIEDFSKAEKLFEKIGFKPYRRQQKLRHTLQLGKVTIDIDTWPRIPTYMELEGPSESDLISAANLIGLDWSKAVFDDARTIIESRYNIPVGKMRWFTFDRFE